MIIGDRVKVVNTRSEYYGQTGTIIDNEGNERLLYYVHFEYGVDLMSISELELIEQQKREVIKKDMIEIKNAKITHADLSMADHGCLTLQLTLEGRGWGVVFGGYCIGHGYLGATKFTGSAKGTEEIMQIMNVVGVERFNDLVGEHVRVELRGPGSTVKKIGNIIEDKWFDYDEFYKEK